ncbi:MAG: serine/threonine-protein kinase [Phycisphaerales bacterium]
MAERPTQPEDPSMRLAGESSSAGASRASASAGASRSGASKAGSGSSVAGGSDSILARLVVEQNFATNEEVVEAQKHARALTQQRSAAGEPEPARTTLGELLVSRQVITARQLERLRAQAEAERKGQAIPGFTILGKLGAGAMATVFKARQLSLDRLVAIKVLPRKFSNNPDFIDRFYAEGRAAAQLNHPNIVQAYDVGKAGEFHYFVMEYVEGATVYDQIVQKKRFTEQGALDIIIQVAEALEHAHAKGLVHRDVKPKNIMISKSGVVKLADMGLARAISDREAAEAEAGKAFGTPYYISPEQVRGEVNVDQRADIYSLGATLYHMLTGRVPFEGKDPNDVMRAHLKTALTAPDHVNPKLSADVSEVIEMMMAKRPDERHQNATDLLEDLRAVRNGEKPVHARGSLGGGKPESLTAVLQQVQAAEAEIQRDKTRAPSPFAHPIVQVILLAAIASVALNIVLLVS